MVALMVVTPVHHAMTGIFLTMVLAALAVPVMRLTSRTRRALIAAVVACVVSGGPVVEAAALRADATPTILLPGDRSDCSWWELIFWVNC